MKGAIGDAVLVLSGPWRFHPGDDAAWARPEFDDSGWGTLDLTPPEGSYDPVVGSSGFVPGWTKHGYPKLANYAWYRLKVELADNQSQTQRLALTMPLDFDDAYQMFVNGQQVGAFGLLMAPRSCITTPSQCRSNCRRRSTAGQSRSPSACGWILPRLSFRKIRAACTARQSWESLRPSRPCCGWRGTL